MQIPKENKKNKYCFTGERFVKEDEEEKDQGKMQSFTIIPKLSKALILPAVDIIQGIG